MSHWIGRRWQFTPFWKITDWGFLNNWQMFWPQKGCDEWHNKSDYVIVPLVGMIVRFRTINREGPVHVYAYAVSQGIPHGRYVQGCDICHEILWEFEV